MERFDELFSLYHSFPLCDNPHILGKRNRDPPSSQIRLHTRKFDGNDPPGLYNIDEYFEFYATPPDERMRLMGLLMEGEASKWFRWMRNTVLLPVVASVSVAASTPPPPWIELPSDVTANILQRLGAEGILTSAQQVCTAWWKVSKDPSLWRVIDFSNPRQGLFNDRYDAMCRRAVYRSQGQLVDLTIQYFGDDALMDYIADRSPNLKRLKLGTCFFISGDCAVRIVAKLLQLEELHFTIRPGLGAAHIERIGNSCPTLKSFSFNGFQSKLQRCEHNSINDRLFRNLHVGAISRSMPNLQHLQVFAHWMGNKGLELILDGCPRLESLDIRRCFDLDLHGDLGKRCRQQIKYLKLPTDSVSDVPWPNCDSGDPFSTSAFCFEHYEYDFYKECILYCHKHHIDPMSILQRLH
ncbi:putative F-box/LRR-repeat protein 9 isoform X1 [Salvia splendens]|uniref:putative F-box/LRR-repeat protein 9 isoform X1 n=1 Tax=Salvia splendens TaxID=180675 RepID=UPI001C26FD0A|nr:putative F-box/LRR-repeat protein 9 isoform X1 [Salvia splendens]